MPRTQLLILFFAINIIVSYYLFSQKTKFDEYQNALFEDIDRKKDIVQGIPSIIESGCKKHPKHKIWCDLMHEMGPIIYDSLQTVDSFKAFIRSIGERPKMNHELFIPYLDSFPPASQKLILTESIYRQLLNKVKASTNAWNNIRPEEAIINSHINKGDSMQLDITLVALWKRLNFSKSGTKIIFLKNKEEIHPNFYPLHYRGDPNDIAIKITNPITERSQIFSYEK